MSEFKSIDELMGGKKPGEVKITCKGMGYNYFSPFFKDYVNDWCGLDDSLVFRSHGGQTHKIWQVYQEPKEKVKRWLWVISNRGIILYFYTDEEAKENIGGPKTKLLWSETEFDV